MVSSKPNVCDFSNEQVGTAHHWSNRETEKDIILLLKLHQYQDSVRYRTYHILHILVSLVAHGYVVIHELVNVRQETARNDSDATEGNADIIHDWVGFTESKLPSFDNELDFLRCIETREVVKSDIEVASDGGGDGSVFRNICDASFSNCGNDIFVGVMGEAMTKQVVVDGVADRAANEAD